MIIFLICSLRFNRHLFLPDVLKLVYVVMSIRNMSILSALNPVTNEIIVLIHDLYV